MRLLKVTEKPVKLTQTDKPVQIHGVDVTRYVDSEGNEYLEFRAPNVSRWVKVIEGERRIDA